MADIIYGKNVVREAISTKRSILKLYILEQNKEWIDLAKKNNIPIQTITAKQMDQMCGGLHQGVVAEVASYQFYPLMELVQSRKLRFGLLLILDGLEDPHNLGAILRIADAGAVDGIIIPKNRSVSLSPTVAKVSTGAIEHVKVTEVTNLTATIKTLKENGFWIVAAENKDTAQLYNQMKYDMPIALIIGSEGKGISRLVLEQADFIVKIPMYGQVNSLNASVSCGILVYEINKYRKD
ncbi:MAG: 23S rRNA (guanosine(2251)-2'-O)-methyltransferase RlmB [Bacilli bacterium]|jgi:23S rRNA (guanosine2251-2'-O)-methyltransferase|nr:23S rRNA (guanosine(2251)-2'-O)-methyltransferase RlmB [Bacilli bacterium]MDY0064147.1 23S rRNA (guanosine(2251)-2'-O)-methyltransferase RlmB [Bacilli bacterium]